MGMYEYSAVCGYGFCLDDIQDPSPEGLLKILDCDPEQKKYLEDEYGKDGLKNLSFADIVNSCDDIGNTGAIFGGILALYIADKYGICMEECQDADCSEYLLYVPSYPWTESKDYTDVHRVTKETIDKAIRETVSILSDSEVKIGEQCCVQYWT